MADQKEQGVIKIDLNEQARQILEKATAKGVEHSFMFVTTFKRYQELIFRNCKKPSLMRAPL